MTFFTSLYVCLRRIKHFSIVNFFSRTFFFHASKTFVEQMHRFKRLVVKSFLVSIVFSKVSSISNSSLDEFFMTINRNSSTSWINFKLCASNENVDVSNKLSNDENVDVSSKSSNDIELFANDNNNELIKIWKDIDLFISTNWFSFTKNFAIRSIISFKKTSKFEFKAKIISLTMIWMMNLTLNASHNVSRLWWFVLLLRFWNIVRLIFSKNWKNDNFDQSSKKRLKIFIASRWFVSSSWFCCAFSWFDEQSFEKIVIRRWIDSKLSSKIKSDHSRHNREKKQACFRSHIVWKTINRQQISVFDISHVRIKCLKTEWCLSR